VKKSVLSNNQKKHNEKQASRKLLADKLAKESKMVAKESIKVLNEFEQLTYEWWNDRQFVKELDRRYKAMESGEDEGVTLEELESSIEAIRLKRYGK
jgi:hypothetical protein